MRSVNMIMYTLSVALRSIWSCTPYQWHYGQYDYVHIISGTTVNMIMYTLSVALRSIWLCTPYQWHYGQYDYVHLISGTTVNMIMYTLSVALRTSCFTDWVWSMSRWSLLALLMRVKICSPDRREQSVSFLNAGSKYVDLIIENNLLAFLKRSQNM